MEGPGGLGQLDADDPVPGGPCCRDGLGGGLVVGPGAEALRAERGLLDLGVGGGRRPDQPEVVDGEGGRRAQDGPDVERVLHPVEQ